ncbi:hypothetical protein FLONG3_4292 [Fusarium longipes]|uniref:Uncharacterized protein n=1 Tax=Fusarium longipes TaxID=694270 RepID=A0A395SYN5_9HYPO|nr:hypothetical protein FLONG3_4292 [Fusarium longipes]
MDSAWKIDILNKWEKHFQDLVIYNNRNGTFELAALCSNSLFHWRSSSTDPSVVSVGKYRKDTLYLSKHPDALYLWAFNDHSGKIDSINLSSNNKIHEIALPDNLVVNSITYHCSTRLSKTICLVQGTVNGYSQLYYNELGSEGSSKGWENWGTYYVGKPVIVESQKTLWVFTTYGYYNDWQYLCYAWTWTENISWAKWYSMPWVGKDWHINSIVGVSARNNPDGYGVMVTNADGAHYIKPNTGGDDWPVVSGKILEYPFYRSSFTKFGGTTHNKVGNFVYLKNGQLSFIHYDKEGSVDSHSLETDLTAFSVDQSNEDDDQIKGFPIVFCKGSATYMAVVIKQDGNRAM